MWEAPSVAVTVLVGQDTQQQHLSEGESLRNCYSHKTVLVDLPGTVLQFGKGSHLYFSNVLFPDIMTDELPANRKLL